ncbi:MAG: hypothetical protein R8K54_06945 [Mariprofundaceae bacterium]
MWQRTFGVGNISVRLESDQQHCTTDIQAITSLFPDSTAEPSLTFSIEQNEDITLSVNGEELWQSDAPGEITAAFEVHLYSRIVQKLVPELASIHAASVSINHQACIFAGISDAGKSSICTKAVMEGNRYLSDEFALLNEAGKIEPFPRPLQWGKEQHPAFTHKMMAEAGIKQASFQFPDTEGNTVSALLWLPKKVQYTPLPLRWVIFPRFDASISMPTLTTIRRGEALMELPQHLHQQQRGDIMLQMLNQRIPKNITFHRLRFSDVHKAWELLKDTLF